MIRRTKPNNLGSMMITLLTILSVGMVASSTASAAYRQVGNFAGHPGELQVSQSAWPEEVQLGGSSGMAVNYTGAGGVPAGTLYATSQTLEGLNISRYTPEAPGGKSALRFSESWPVKTQAEETAAVEAGQPPYVRCGPEGEEIEKEGKLVHPICKPHPTGGRATTDVEVDQTTGNVYVFFNRGTGLPAVTIYSPDGSKVVSRFAVAAPFNEPVENSPGKVHQTVGGSPIAVNGTGEVFIFDLGEPNFTHRLMVFKPKVAGNYSEYEYKGQGSDIGAGVLGQTQYPSLPIVDEAGNVYVASEQFVQKYNPATPGAAPTCSFFFKTGGIISLTINPKSGEVFFASYIDRKIHRLNPCSNGSFTEAETTAYSPPRSEITTLAVDPSRAFESGLQAGILYAASPSGEGGQSKGTFPNIASESAMGYMFAPANEVPPLISDEGVSEVTSSSARLEGNVNPKANPSRYYFQVVSAQGYDANEPSERFAGATQIPLGGAPIEGAVSMPVAATIGGLAPGAEYHYRLVASSFCLTAQPTKECIGTGTGKTFRTYVSEGAQLLDGRAYELVSPADKQGGQVYPADPLRSSCLSECKPGGGAERFPMLSSPDGGLVVYEGEPFGPGGAVIENQYLSSRTSAGWITTSLAPPALQNRSGNGYKAFDPGLTVGVLQQGVPSLTADGLAGYPDFYSQVASQPSMISPILTTTNATPTCGRIGETSPLRLTYVGGSENLSKLFFEANDVLGGGAAGTCGQSNLYEWSGGSIAAVNVLPGGTVAEAGAVFGSGSLLASGSSNTPVAVTSHAISTDGSRKFFTAVDGRLYVRVNGPATLEVPSPGNCKASVPLAERVCFLSASADGSRVLLSNGQIDALNPSESAYEAAADLTGGQGGFVGLAGQAQGLDPLYFVDTADLTPGQKNSEGATAVAGKNNLYGRSGSSTIFVATLGAADGSREFGDWTAAPVVRTAEASSRGRFLAFSSTSPLTGFDNTGRCGPVIEGVRTEGACPEAFIYDLQTQTLACASCNPSEAAPAGPATLRTDRAAAAYLPQPRYLTDSGRLFFDSGDRLVPSDTNGQVEDVYEYEPNGVGTCTETGACLSLVSSGRGATDSNFLTMDESGDNVFFTTSDQLVKADTDDLVDLYDARVGGGFPEPEAAPECRGESCQPVTPPPGQALPSSTGVVPESSSKKVSAACKKGQVKRKGHCVKKKHKSKKMKGGKRKKHSHATKTKGEQ